MAVEQWRTIAGFNNQYQVSDFGNIKYLSKTVNIGLGRTQFYPEKVRTKFCVGNHGYYTVTLNGNKHDLIHRIVATAFIENPNNLPCVNHKDGNKLNNRVDNLEWITYSDNAKHAYAIGLKKGAWIGKFGKDHHRSTPIIQMNKQGEFIKEWGSQSMAAASFNISQQNIWAAINKTDFPRTCRGFRWKYKINNNGN